MPQTLFLLISGTIALGEDHIRGLMNGAQLGLLTGGKAF